MTELEIRRSLPYPAERIWHALTDPAALTAWFWPARFDPVVEVDLRVGGRYRIAGPTAGMAVAGEYRTVEPPHLLVFTWRWEGETEETFVTMELAPDSTGTQLLVRHQRFSSDDRRDEHARGWSDCLDRLPDWLAAATQTA